MKRLVIAAASLALAAGLGGCALGTVTPAEDPNLVHRAEAYAVYMTVYQGCPADFKATYRGTIWVEDLPSDTRETLRSPEQPAGLPAIADEFGGTVATLPDHPGQAIMLRPYTGVCE